jgi:hypothetical protein
LCSWDGKPEPPYPASISWDRILWAFCLDWPQTVIFQISASQVARIIVWATTAGSILFS